MKKYFVSSDIHSFYDEWQTALIKAGFEYDNPDHIIIVCGDLLDRGPKPRECLDFVNILHDKGRAILIKGNHEWLLEEIFTRGYFKGHDVHNGTDKTCLALAPQANSDYDAIEIVKEDGAVKYYLSHLLDYCEIGDRVFVHGWVPMTYATQADMWDDKRSIPEKWREVAPYYWKDATWYNGMFQWHQGHRLKDKVIYCGHWHASYGNSKYHNDGAEFPEGNKVANFHTFKDEGIVALDACTTVSGFVNVETFEA